MQFAVAALLKLRLPDPRLVMANSSQDGQSSSEPEVGFQALHSEAASLAPKRVVPVAAALAILARGRVMESSDSSSSAPQLGWAPPAAALGSNHAAKGKGRGGWRPHSGRPHGGAAQRRRRGHAPAPRDSKPPSLAGILLYRPGSVPPVSRRLQEAANDGAATQKFAQRSAGAIAHAREARTITKRKSHPDSTTCTALMPQLLTPWQPLSQPHVLGTELQLLALQQTRGSRPRTKAGLWAIFVQSSQHWNTTSATTLAQQVGVNLPKVPIYQGMYASAILHSASSSATALRDIIQKAATDWNIVSRRVVLRWDETPSQLRPQGGRTAETLKVVQTDVILSQLLEKDGAFKTVRQIIPSNLLAVDRTTAACLCAVLERTLQLVDAELCNREPLEILGVTDMAAENPAALVELGHRISRRAPDSDIWTEHGPCDQHKKHNAQKHQWSSDRALMHTTGLLSVALSMRNGGSHRVWCSELSERPIATMHIRHQPPPVAEWREQHLAFLDVVLPIPTSRNTVRQKRRSLSQLLARRAILLIFPNGDPFETGGWTHWCFGGCCHDEADTELKVKTMLTWALSPHALRLWHRSRWCGANEAIEDASVMVFMNFISLPVNGWVQRTRGKPSTAPRPSEAPQRMAHDRLLALQGGPSAEVEQHLPIEDAQPVASARADPAAPAREAESYAEMNFRVVTDSAKYLQRHNLQRELLFLKAASADFTKLVKWQFFIAGKRFEEEQLAREARGERRDYAACIVARGDMERWYISRASRDLLGEMGGSDLLHPLRTYLSDQISVQDSLWLFRFIAQGGGAVFAYLKRAHAADPYRQFKVLGSPHECQSLLDTTPCTRKLAFEKLLADNPSVDSLRSASTQARMIWKAIDFPTCISTLGQDHGATRRVTVSQTQTSRPSLQSVSAKRVIRKALAVHRDIQAMTAVALEPPAILDSQPAVETANHPIASKRRRSNCEWRAFTSRLAAEKGHDPTDPTVSVLYRLRSPAEIA